MNCTGCGVELIEHRLLSPGRYLDARNSTCCRTLIEDGRLIEADYHHVAPALQEGWRGGKLVQL